MDSNQTQHKTDYSRQARDQQCLQTQEGHIGYEKGATSSAMIQFAYVGRGTQAGREAHFEIPLEVAEHWYEDEELVYASKDAPMRKVLEELASED